MNQLLLQLVLNLFEGLDGLLLGLVGRAELNVLGGGLRGSASIRHKTMLQQIRCYLPSLCLVLELVGWVDFDMGSKSPFTGCVAGFIANLSDGKCRSGHEDEIPFTLKLGRGAGAHLMLQSVHALRGDKPTEDPTCAGAVVAAVSLASEVGEGEVTSHLAGLAARSASMLTHPIRLAVGCADKRASA